MIKVVTCGSNHARRHARLLKGKSIEIPPTNGGKLNEKAPPPTLTCESKDKNEAWDHLPCPQTNPHTIGGDGSSPEGPP